MKNPFAAHAIAVEQERCEADLLYEILFHPNHVLTLKDPATGQETKMTLIDRMLSAGYELMAKKYSPDYGKSRMIADSKTMYMQTPAADPTIKLFNFLFILAKETEIQALVLKGYVVNHPGNLWGANADLHFADYVKAVQGMVDKTLLWRYNMLDNAHVIRSMVYFAKVAYVTT
jgi:hypothetical protein